MENYIILLKYIKCVLLLFTEVMGPTMNLISRTHNFCERSKYAFNVLPEYNIITRPIGISQIAPLTRDVGFYEGLGIHTLVREKDRIQEELLHVDIVISLNTRKF